MDTGTLTTIALAGSGAVGTAAGWAVRTYMRAQVQPLQAQLNQHEATDTIIHEHVSSQLASLDTKTDCMNAKLDRLIERHL